ncbi:hypothetical protein D2E64_26265 [Mycobacteroides abscessus]|uniref:hypothetical protein n=1 Tax=Mycobacteroides abscessus TaxID=36809 RepID=UPI000D3E57C7|nr:hypothetical protein [Mycobacteroides abscessus]MBN7567162.1 hypothetical protein [Mycobacteroides abscessus subsp. massiliense]PVA72244.1 hypothetical protein DDJ76_22850 [Mycobacteroides abscessus]RIS03916.1 hypothetical protein D2E63_22470 [Mycobacteroides abscessus]RIS11327.1 hypothetical protein D2E69_22340 [Mycobacteroides abscessus]RIS23568.1 hypothetical protein D2E67_22115 [Mycobacteroides abscessus]
MSNPEEPRRGTLYTELSKVPIYLSRSESGVSLPEFRRWRIPDALAYAAGLMLTPLFTFISYRLETGYTGWVFVCCLVITVVSIKLLSRLPKYGPTALTRWRWKLEARSPRTTCTHSVAVLAGRVVDPETGRLVSAGHRKQGI